MPISDYPLTHRALVCTRMDMFQDLDNVNVLSTRGAVLPKLKMDLENSSVEQAKRIIEILFPVFLHNLIRADGFPLREKLTSALEQMESNIQDSAENPMVRLLLTRGLTGEVCDPGGLPDDFDAKRAVALYLAREEWDTLYRTFHMRLVNTMVKQRRELAKWIQSERKAQVESA
jgi:hypothetical protein